MSIAVRCPNKDCKRLVRVADSLRGKMMKCPACGAGLRIPAAPQPAELDEMLPGGPVGHRAGTPQRSKTGVEEVSERVADSAAAAASAMGPILKLVIAFMLLVGLVFLGVKVIFPMLWADKPISSVTTQEIDPEAARTRALEEERNRQRRPLDPERRDKVTSAIAEDDLPRAKRLLDTLRGDQTVDQTDVSPLELEFKDALEKKVQSLYAEVEQRLTANEWTETLKALESIATLDSAETVQDRFRGYERRAKAGQATDMMAESRQAADSGDYDKAMDLATAATRLDPGNREISKWIGDMGTRRKAGAKFNTGTIVADVYQDNRRIGDTSKTIWGLEGKRYMTFKLQAQGYVPREVVESLNLGGSKLVNVELVPAVPDALWVASLVEGDAGRWLALRALGGEDAAVAAATKSYEEKCRKAPLNAKKRTVWKLRAEGKSRYALEYSVLGSSVRYIDLATGETVKTTKDKVTKADQLETADGAKRWLAAIAARAEKTEKPCEAFREFAKFVEFFPDMIELALQESGEQIKKTAGRIAELSSCKSGEPRDAMTIRDRIEAEIEAWNLAKQPPPKALLDQKKALRS